MRNRNRKFSENEIKFVNFIGFRNEIHARFRDSLESRGVDPDKYEMLRDEFRSAETRRLTLKRDSTSYWRNVSSRLFSVTGAKEEVDLVREQQEKRRQRQSTVNARRESHLGELVSAWNQRKNSSTLSVDSVNQKVTLVSLRDDIWRCNSAHFNDLFIKSVREFVRANAYSAEFIRNDQCFRQRLQYFD